MPFFSVIIPAYNRALIVETAINAVLQQSFTDFELIISDDGSTDDTKEVVSKYLSDNRVKYVYQINKGVCAARNNGTLQATGEYLVFLDSDDTVEPDWLADFYKCVFNSGIDIAFCNMKVQQKDNSFKLVDAAKPYADSTVKGMYIAGLFTLKRSLFLQAGMYDEKMKFGENTELGYRLKAFDLKMGFVKNYNIIYSPSQDGGSKNLENKLTSNLYILEKHAAYFNGNIRSKKLFMQVAAVAAARLGKYKQANDIFLAALKADKTDMKLWLQYLLSLFPVIAKFKWKVK